MPQHIILYVVSPPPYEDSADGEDHDEWFTSCEAATRRFNYWVKSARNNPGVFKFNRVELYQVGMAHLTPRALLLAVLNRKGYIHYRTRIRVWPGEA